MSQEGLKKAARGAVAQHERSVAPDLARGLMLLLICIAHVPLYISNSAQFRTLNHPSGGDLLDNIIQFATIMIVDLRSYPMFAVLFGYGLAMIVTRQLAAGTSQQTTRKLIRRRCLYLILFGAVHALIVFSFDILTVYGLVGLLFGSLLFSPKRKLLRVIGWLSLIMVSLLLIQAWLLSGGNGTPMLDYSTIATSYGGAIEKRLFEYPFWIVYSLIAMPLIIPVLLGFWAGSQRLLENPHQHRTLLKKISVLGITVSFLGALPLALTVFGFWQKSSYLITLHSISGIFGGIGYIALFGLISAKISAAGSRGKIVQALVATGKRSLTSYLLHSLILALLLSSWGLGLGKQFHSFQIFFMAILTWLILVFISVFLERKGQQGPAEVLLRKLIYRKSY
ncbi:DUF418 domain-containing protein [Paenibacillus assamensis]|uniref:DUF418 domain-containing protein n=1 Tax=Paenibacillus assamensis TaxID=311244 RepID=UPI00068856DF|nr:DUF418 domain-containing protein [Paenibacillus assamensis]